VVLFLFQSLAVSFNQNTFVPESFEITQIYGVSSLEVTMTSVIHMLLHVPVSFPANYVVDKYGCRVGTFVCGLFLCLGCWT